MSRHPKPCAAGFTLIEVVLAMFLLLIGATTILGMLSFGAGSARTASLRSEATAALPAVVMELEETLFPLVLDEAGIEVAGEPIAARDGLTVPGYPELAYSYRATPLPTEGELEPFEYVVDIEISWREGGEQRSVNHTTILLREIPFGERLRQRFVEGLEPLTWEEHQAALRAARSSGDDQADSAQGLQVSE